MDGKTVNCNTWPLNVPLVGRFSPCSTAVEVPHMAAGRSASLPQATLRSSIYQYTTSTWETVRNGISGGGSYFRKRWPQRTTALVSLPGSRSGPNTVLQPGRARQQSRLGHLRLGSGRDSPRAAGTSKASQWLMRPIGPRPASPQQVSGRRSELFSGFAVSAGVEHQGAKAMPVRNVQDLLINELRDLYDAEKQLVKALPKVAKAAFRNSCAKLSRSIWRRPGSRSNAWRTLSSDSRQVLVASAARRCGASSTRPVR